MAFVKQEFLLNGCDVKGFEAKFRAFGMPVFENTAVQHDFIDLIYNHVKPKKVVFVQLKLTGGTKVYSLYGDGVLLAKFRNGKMVQLCLPGVKKIGVKETDDENYFLSTTGVENVTHAIFPDLEETGDDCMRYARELRILGIPKIKKTGEFFVHDAEKLETLFGPEWKKSGAHSLGNAKNLRIFYGPKLTSPGSYFLYENTAMKIITLSSIKKLPLYFMGRDDSTLGQDGIFAPKLTSVELGCAEIFYFFMDRNNRGK